MNPFTSSNDYYGAKFTKFNQKTVLDESEPGICYSLALNWIKHFFSGENLISKITDEEDNARSDFLKKIKEEQKGLELPDWAYSNAFRTKIAANAEKYGLERCALAAIIPNDLSETENLQQGNQACLIFLKENSHDKVGHVICAASRRSENNFIEIGIFDASYGELIFNYDSSVNFKQKTVREQDSYLDTEFPINIKIYKDALEDLVLKFYPEPPEKQTTNNKHDHYKVFKVLRFKKVVPEKTNSFAKSKLFPETKSKPNTQHKKVSDTTITPSTISLKHSR